MCNDTILRLEELQRIIDEGTIVWEFEGKQVRAWSLWNRHARVAVSRVLIPEGTIFPAHIHNEVENIVCFGGKGKIIIGEGSTTFECVILKPGVSIALEPSVPHLIEAETDLWLIATTVPASEGYPE